MSARPPRTRRSGLSQALLAAAVVPVVVLLPAGPAAAHTQLTGSVPSAGAVVPADLSQVVLSFTSAVRADLATVVVTGPGGEAAARGAATVRGTDVVQPLTTPLPAGAWTVAYRVVAGDGHPITGTLPLTVEAAATSSPAPSPTASPASAPSAATTTDVRTAIGSAPAEDEGGGVSLPLVGAGGLAVVLLGGALVRRRRPSGSRPSTRG